MGTIGGNLLQATRCWYWRLGFDCWLHGGERCFAKDGAHREHAIFGTDRCASAHPSDVAAALLALGATLRTTRREFPLAELYRLPTDDDRNTTRLEAGELILDLDVPQPEASTYLKAMDRRKWAFPLVGVAAAKSGDGAIRIALAGVAPIPWTLDSPAALDEATPLPGTAYKVEIARALVRRALEHVSSQPSS
jgi:xanthine dehydrogenase YagS FAD-binding subunit